jgi:hypothetical protein
MFKLLAVISGFLLSQLSFAAACPASTSTTTAGNGNCTITGAQSTIQLNFNSGFDDATAIAAVGGNLGTTVGAQRKLSFIKAGEIIADQVNSSQTLIVDADFSLLSCSTSAAVLGSAGATTNTGNVSPMPGAAVLNTFYPIGLINAMGNTDYGAGISDVTAQFNSNIGNAGCLQASNGWYYGYDAPPSNYIGFTTVLLHEVTHGLGFASLVDASTGIKPSNLDDIFSNNLYSKLNSTNWSNAAGLSNAQRAASAISGDGLLWDASNVNTQAIGVLTAGFQDNDSSSSFTSGDRVQMYAPNPVESGSSVSHFDTAAAPNELMEPQYTAGQMDLGLALYLLKDIGWSVSAAASNTAPVMTAVDQSTNEDTAKTIDASSWATDADGSDTLAFTVNSACASNITCSINSDGTNFVMTPAANHNGGTHTITINVSDGNGGSDSDTFNLNVIAQNDDPSISGIPNQNVVEGSFVDVALAGYASDVDGDGLSYSDTACGANLTCSFPSANTIRITASGGAGTTVQVTVEADDSNGGTNTDTFDVNISSSTPSTTVNIGGGEINNGGTLDLGLGSGQINVNNGSGNYSYSLDYNSSDVSSLITSNGTGLTLGLPSSGEFAGDYTLTITDNGDGDVISITIKRPLRLVWSATSILEGDTAQTLKIEGGADGTVYTLSEIAGSELIFKNHLGTVISNSSADNANDFNAASVYLSTESVSGINPLDVEVRVSSTYDDVDETVQVVPAISHDFTVEDSNGTAINNAKLSLTGGESILNNMNLESDYYSNASGLVTIELPDTGDSLALTTTASGYTADNLSVDNGITTHTITLTEMANGVTLTGAISALGTQDFTAHPPTVLITYSDGSSDTVPVTVSTVSQANFTHNVDINLKSMSSMEVKQEDSLNINVAMSNVQQNQSYNILLERHVAVVSVGSGSGGGSLPWYSLLLLPLLMRFKRVKK